LPFLPTRLSFYRLSYSERWEWLGPQAPMRQDGG